MFILLLDLIFGTKQCCCLLLETSFILLNLDFKLIKIENYVDL